MARKMEGAKKPFWEEVIKEKGNLILLVEVNLPKK